MHAPFTSALGTPRHTIGRRAAARLRLSMPAKLVTIYETRPCIILNLSQTGARLGLENPLALGDAAFLQCASIDHFANVVRSQKGTNALEFEVPLTHDQVLAIRTVAENFDELERRDFRQIARDWITGGY
ncbi:PilZ domain-containing protein [uncultured Erythrobacter sp.]|uniref:PilZ domain-containing protein n=1 Tax=uncultured Erythrobacter sp. TaxID=263913 RepID=UPI002613AE7F|nr:PilZ domain-containing protein [uncultured Erythrobacter sp.]